LPARAAAHPEEHADAATMIMIVIKTRMTTMNRQDMAMRIGKMKKMMKVEEEEAEVVHVDLQEWTRKKGEE
jgi:hypothetical protein